MSEEKRNTLAENYISCYLFAFMFMWLVPGEISAYSRKIPEYKALSSSEGRVTFSRTSGRWGHQFLLIPKQGNEVALTCNLNYTDSLYCPPFNIKKEGEFYSGKHVEIKYDPNTNALMELKVNGEKLLDYETQKSKYKDQIGSSPPIGIVATTIFLILGTLGLRMNKDNKKIGKY